MPAVPLLLLPQAPDPGCVPVPGRGGQEGDREQDGDFSRGCWENAWLPGLVLKRKRGSKAASPLSSLSLAERGGLDSPVPSPSARSRNKGGC